VAGFIGSHLAERLLADGHEVVGCDAFTDYYPRIYKEANLAGLLAASGFRFVEGDLNRLDLDALLDGQQWVFHLAAQAGVRSSWGPGFGDYVACNITATQRLLEAAVRASALKRFVYASSSSVYGNVAELPAGEDTPTRPTSPYGVTKLAGEHLCSVYWRAFQVPIVLLRYFTAYGPRQRPDMAFHRFGRALLRGDELAVFGDGEQTRDFTYVTDLVEANVRAAAAPGLAGQVFNIGGGVRVSLREAIRVLVEVSGRAARVRWETIAHGDVRDTFADTTRAQHALDYQPTVCLRDGLAAELSYLEQIYAVSAVPQSVRPQRDAY
jgi:UDP-glucose 4-epimerase